MQPENNNMIQSLSLVFPMHNEREYIRDTVAKAQDVIKNIIEDYEIIIVDDASYDGSGQIAEQLSRQNPRIKVIHNERNRKLGGSLKVGFASAGKEYVLYSDIDMPFEFSEIKKAIEYLSKGKADLVSAYRLNKCEDGLRRYVYSVIYNFFIRYLFGLNIRDVNFSFKLIRNNLLKQLKLCSEGSFIDAEMLIKASRIKAKIGQFGTKYLPRNKGASQLSTFGVILNIIYEAVLFRLGLLKKRCE